MDYGALNRNCREDVMTDDTLLPASVTDYLRVCLCDLDDEDLQFHPTLGQWELCNEHKAAKLASIGMRCAVMLLRVDENGNFTMVPIKQLPHETTPGACADGSE
jgi:hypothetical protein